MDSERDRIRMDVEAQNARVAALLGELPDDQFQRRPDPARWSIAEHLAHVAIFTDLYVSELRRVIARARERGPKGEGPYRRGPIGRLVVRSIAPPVRRRMSSPKKVQPPPVAGRDAASGTFHEAQDALLATLERAGGVDLGRAIVPSPVTPLPRLRAIQAFEAVVAHTDRHLWLIDRMRAEIPTARSRNPDSNEMP